jgi:chromodomain-helicase-DNA-binding protein 1
MASDMLTNGHASPSDLNVTTTGNLSATSESEQSLHEDSAAQGASSDEDAPGEQDDTDEHMASDTESSDDEDADGEADGDYDSESPAPAEVDGRHSRSSSSDDSSRPPKRKASVEDDEHITQNPELYGLRRSVRGIPVLRIHGLTSHRDALDQLVAL